MCSPTLIMHNTEQTTHSEVGSVAMEKFYQSRASAWCASGTRLEVHSKCRIKISSHYILSYFILM